MNASGSPAQNTPPSLHQYLIGGLFGLLVAAAGAAGWVALALANQPTAPTLATRRMFGAVAVLTGMLTGFAVRQGIRKASIGGGVLGGLLTLGALLGAHYTIVMGTLLRGARAQGYTGVTGVSFLDTLRFLDGWAWLQIALGVFFGVSLAAKKYVSSPQAKPSQPPETR